MALVAGQGTCPRKASLHVTSPQGIVLSCRNFVAHMADAFVQSGEIAHAIPRSQNARQADPRNWSIKSLLGQTRLVVGRCERCRARLLSRRHACRQRRIGGNAGNDCIWCKSFLVHGSQPRLNLSLLRVDTSALTPAMRRLGIARSTPPSGISCNPSSIPRQTDLERGGHRGGQGRHS